jgi:hypothetical protein
MEDNNKEAGQGETVLARTTGDGTTGPPSLQGGIAWQVS